MNTNINLTDPKVFEDALEASIKRWQPIGQRMKEVFGETRSINEQYPDLSLKGTEQYYKIAIVAANNYLHHSTIVM